VVSATQFKEILESAWMGLRPPKEDEIVYDNSGRHAECNQVKEFFRGRSYKDVTLAAFQDYCGDPSACLCFMRAEAYRYYLPAYMLISIFEYNDADVIVDSLINSLTAPEPHEAEAHERFHARMDQFTSSQRMVVRTFLERILDQHPVDYGEDAQLALDRYWSSAASPS
jgi:hypothetical protein